MEHINFVRFFPSFTLKELTDVINKKGNDFISDQAALREVGVIFMTEDSSEAHYQSEKCLVSQLNTNDVRMQTIALLFLKHSSAVTTQATKNELGNFESDPSNGELMTTVHFSL